MGTGQFDKFYLWLSKVHFNFKLASPSKSFCVAKSAITKKTKTIMTNQRIFILILHYLNVGFNFFFCLNYNQTWTTYIIRPAVNSVLGGHKKRESIVAALKDLKSYSALYCTCSKHISHAQSMWNLNRSIRYFLNIHLQNSHHFKEIKVFSLKLKLEKRELITQHYF